MKYQDLLLKKEQIRSAQNKILFNLPFWISAGIAALVAVIYNLIFRRAEEIAFEISSSQWIYFSAPLAILASFLLGHVFSKQALGSGIPQVMAALEVKSDCEKPLLKKLLSFPMLFVKIIGSSVAVMGGGVVGREGPTLQVSAAIFYQVYRFWPKSLPMPNLLSMILAGGAAGLAAAFNTPLGGIVFAIEELSKTRLSEVRTAVFQAVIMAGIIAQLFLGNYLYLGNRSFNGIPFSAVYETAVIASLVGLCAGLFSEGLFKMNRFRARLSFSKQVLMTLLCGGAVSLLIFLTQGASIGSGKEVMLRLLEDPYSPSDFLLPIARVGGLFFTYISGVIGGIFAPSLSGGASLGHFLAGLFEFQNIRLMILVGMVAFLTGVTRSPFTSFVLVLEMSASNEIILYLMLAATLSNLAARLVSPRGFYERITETILPKTEREPPKSYGDSAD